MPAQVPALPDFPVRGECKYSVRACRGDPESGWHSKSVVLDLQSFFASTENTLNLHCLHIVFVDFNVKDEIQKFE